MIKNKIITLLRNNHLSNTAVIGSNKKIMLYLALIRKKKYGNKVVLI